MSINNSTITIHMDFRQVHDWKSFHALFKAVFGFPDFYGNNMDAWIDCMSSIANPESGMTAWWIGTADTLVIEVTHAAAFKKRLPEIYESLSHCTGFVNERFQVSNEQAVIKLVDN